MKFIKLMVITLFLVTCTQADEHDIEVASDYADSINGIRLVYNGTPLLDDVTQITVKEIYEIKYKVRNNGNATEKTNITVYFEDIILNKRSRTINPRESIYLTEKLDTSNITSGYYRIKVEASAVNDSKPENNIKIREIRLITENETSTPTVNTTTSTTSTTESTETTTPTTTTTSTKTTSSTTSTIEPATTTTSMAPKTTTSTTTTTKKTSTTKTTTISKTEEQAEEYTETYYKPTTSTTAPKTTSTIVTLATTTTTTNPATIMKPTTSTTETTLKNSTIMYSTKKSASTTSIVRKIEATGRVIDTKFSNLDAFSALAVVSAVGLFMIFLKKRQRMSS